MEFFDEIGVLDVVAVDVDDEDDLGFMLLSLLFPVRSEVLEAASLVFSRLSSGGTSCEHQ